MAADSLAVHDFDLTTMGLLLSIISQSFPPKPKFTIDEIPDMTGKTVIVTGSTAGMGKETVKAYDSALQQPITPL